MTHVTCRLTAKNQDQFRNSTLGNRVWATFTFLHLFYTSADTRCTIVELGVSATQQFHDSGRRRVMSAAFNLLLLMLLLLLLLLLSYGLHLSSRPH